MCADCQRLHEQLQQQEGEMFGLRKRISRLRGELRYERRKYQALVKENRQNEKPKLRKGRKRGVHGRNG